MTVEKGAEDRVQATKPAAPADAGLRYVARQPILDLHGQVYGYELLFRNGPETIFSGDGNLATRTVLDNTVMFGWDQLASGAMVFVNCTHESLTEDLVNVLPPQGTVLEVLESLEPTPELVEACQRAKDKGYLIALDDFIWRPELQPLVALADLIKIDFTLSSAEDRRRMIHQIGKCSVAWLAEKIETQKEYELAVEEGFTLFQGYYFCRPVVLKNRKVPPNRLSQIQILQMMRDEMVDLKRLSKLVEREASLTYRLLKLVNSPVCPIRQEVRSVETALMTVGQETFRRMATLAITSEMNSGQPAELLRMAFVRGRFCELMAPAAALDPTEQYLLGILSLLPAMLRLPAEELVASLPLRTEIQLALEGREVPEGKVLDWLVQHEQANWAACDRIVAQNGLNKQALTSCYEQALMWAAAAMEVS